MRTTLKRGMGRASTLNGNGRAVLPPPVLDPMRRYRQPPPPSRSTRRMVGKVFGWIVLVVLVVGSGLAGGLYLYGHETLNAIGPRTPQMKRAVHDLSKVPAPSQAATALVVGYDQRAGAGGFGAKDSRSDTLMLIRADPQLDTLSLFSFPRDLVVPIYCNQTSAYATDRINTAWTDCGSQGTLDTVQKLTGIPVNYLITLNFHGFKLIVNKLHGVYMNVDHRYYIPPNTGTAAINLEPGYQRLDGEQALEFVRFRHFDSDLYRNARQQLFLEALKDRLSGGFSLLQIPQLIGAIKHSVEIGSGGVGGAPSMSEIQSYVGLGTHLKPGHIFRVTIDNLQNCGIASAEICASQSDIQAAADSFMHPDITVASRANAVALGRKPTAPKQTALKRSEIRTLVLNGTTVGGLARDTSYKLAVAGFHTVQLPPPTFANTPTPTYTSNYVYFDPVQPNAKAAGSQLKEAMGPNTRLAALPPLLANLAQEAGNPLAIVVVGTAFGGEIVNPQAHLVHVAPRQPPSVRQDPGATLGQLQQIRAKVPFRIMVPQVIERNSNLSSLEPARAFKPAGAGGAHELALTYVTGAGNVYWNIIETDWTSAPILRKETDKYKVGVRKYHLFTTGGHIHMIVLYKSGVSYWVVNTLRDELSNETMLAIAKGLQPLGR
jgi:LCP family protein required for cell wall assembly